MEVARTKVKTGSDPVFDEEFLLDVPPDILTFTITLYNNGKRSKDTQVAELTVDLNTLINGEEVIYKESVSLRACPHYRLLIGLLKAKEFENDLNKKLLFSKVRNLTTSD